MAAADAHACRQVHVWTLDRRAIAAAIRLASRSGRRSTRSSPSAAARAAGACGVNLHDNDLVPIDALAGRSRSDRSQLPARAQRHRHGRADGDDQPLHRSRLSRRRVHVARPGACAPTRCRRRCARWSSASSWARRTYVFWGGREGAEVDAAKDPIEAIKRFREAINFLCAHAIDQGYKLQIRARGQAQRAARRPLLPHHGVVSRLHRHARSPGHGRRQPRGRARAHGRPQRLPRRRAGDRGGQAVSHRSERSEVRALRSGSAVRIRVDQDAVLRREAARRVRLRRPAAFRRASVPDRETPTASGTSRAGACARTCC